MECRTCLYEQHVRLGAKMVDFSGWEMPLHYGSQLEEHKAVRTASGVFDVSHMKVVDVLGEQRQAFLQYLLANDVNKLRVLGQAQYTMMLNEQGGILDDCIVYRLPDRYRIVVNCGTAKRDIEWMRQQSTGFEFELQVRDDLSMLAIQGPQALETASRVLGEEARALIEGLLPFTSQAMQNWQIARTGYTGEDGLEIILPHENAQTVWKSLVQAGVQPCGLGARDTLRLEAGLNLYGQDMSETFTPFESNVGWTVSLNGDDRNFIGRKALTQQKASGVPHQLVGLIYTGKGVLRAHYPVFCNGSQVGEITSGSFSPTLDCSVALSRIKAPVAEEQALYTVKIRNKEVEVRLVKPPFVKKGVQCPSV